MRSRFLATELGAESIRATKDLFLRQRSGGSSTHWASTTSKLVLRLSPRSLRMCCTRR